MIGSCELQEDRDIDLVANYSYVPIADQLLSLEKNVQHKIYSMVSCHYDFLVCCLFSYFVLISKSYVQEVLLATEKSDPPEYFTTLAIKLRHMNNIYHYLMERRLKKLLFQIY